MVHPRRSVLMRVLGDVESSPEIDTLVIDTHPGDRWMLCSDGLSGVVPFDDMATLWTTGQLPRPRSSVWTPRSMSTPPPETCFCCRHSSVRQSVRWVSYDDTFFILFSPCTASDGFLLNIQFAVCPDR